MLAATHVHDVLQRGLRVRARQHGQQRQGLVAGRAVGRHPGRTDHHPRIQAIDAACTASRNCGCGRCWLGAAIAGSRRLHETLQRCEAQLQRVCCLPVPAT